MNTEFDISIVMAFYNRKQQALKTLDGFERQYGGRYNFEVVIVDDDSTKKNDLGEDIKGYSFPINLLRVSNREKGGRSNPCLAYNKGFKAARGRIVMIQNPECYHVGDIIKHCLDNLTEQSYFSYSCYSANSFEITDELLGSQDPYELIKNEDFNRANSKIIGLSWYNHPSERDVGYHFCSAIHNSKLQLMGGFDKRFAEGYCFDDCEFALSVKHNLRLDFKIICPDNGFVVHQFHEDTGCKQMAKCAKTFGEKRSKNKCVYDAMKEYHEEKKFRYPKLLHLYWDGGPLSFPNLATVLSFNRHNRFWKINVFVPNEKTEALTWKTSEQKTRYEGRCYFDRLYDIPNVFVHKIDLGEVGFRNDAPEVIKSDYFRYYILQRHGGIWSDFDIIYTASVEDKMNFKGKNAVIFRCFSHSDPKKKKDMVGCRYFPVGFFMCKPDNDFFRHILGACAENYDPEGYQSIGSVMWDKLFKPNQPDAHVFGDDIQVCDEDYYLPYAYNELDELLAREENTLPDHNVGVHWFNGSGTIKRYLNELDGRLDDFKPTCFLDKLVGQYL